MMLLKDQAYTSLLEMIQNGSLEYGKTYSLRAISAQMEMSTTPVRDAIQRLCDEGRMDMLPSRGIRLHRLTKEELLQHYHFSSAIEGYCVYVLAKASAEGKGGKHLSRMERLVEELGKRLDPSVPFQEYFTCDKGFHQAILESLEDPYFKNLQYSAMGFYDHPELQHDSAITREEIFQCHKKIFELIKKGAPQDAYEAMIEHSDLMIRDAGISPNEIL